MGYKVLDGVRIIDLTMVYAGPMATRMLADLGAEVIKIESASRCDVFTRANVYPENEPGEQPWNRGGFFHTLNAGKLGISLNLGTERGREIFKRLVGISDAVVENFSPRVMENWGLTYEELRKVKPDIVMIRMSGLGHSGPLRDFYAYMPGMEAMSGLAYITGHPDGPPLTSGSVYGDWVLGAAGAAALLIALYVRQVTGKGQCVEVTGREAIMSHIGEILMGCILNGTDRTRMGNAHFTAAPHGCYRCKGDDQWVTIAVTNDEQWESFRQAIGNPDWTSQEKFSDALSRWKNHQELDKLVEEWTSKHERDEVMAVLQEAGVPSGAVLNMRELYLNPHLAQRGLFEVIDHGAGIGKRPVLKQMPAKFTEIEEFVPRRAPQFAEHNEYVFCKLLGMPERELRKLEEAGVIGKSPVFPQGKPTRLDLITRQKSGELDPDYLGKLRIAYGQDIALSNDNRGNSDGEN